MKYDPEKTIPGQNDPKNDSDKKVSLQKIMKWVMGVIPS